MSRVAATVGICLGSALVALILSAVNTALPTIRSDLGATLVQIQWMVNIAAIARGSLVATLGRLSDMFGRRRLFIWGMASVLLGALVGGFAPNIGWLIVAMLIIGAASAALLVATQALLSHLYPDNQMGRAMAFWSVALGVGIATGSLLSGSLLEVISWRWAFFSTIPFVLVALVLTWLAVAESRDEKREKRIDWVGLSLLIVGVGALVTAIIQGQVWGWGSAPTVTLFVVAVVAVGLFLWVETHIAYPLLRPKLFANRMFISGAATNLCFICFMLTTIFLTPLFLNFVLGASPLQVGLLVAVLAVPVMLVGPLAGLLTERWGPKPQVLFGLAILAVGSVWMTTFSEETALWQVALPLILYGIGWGTMQGSAATAAITSLPKELAGAASGGFVMMGGLGGAIGLAVAGTIVGSVYSEELGIEPSPAAFADGFHAGMWFLLGVSLFALLLVLVVMRNGRRGW